MSPVATGSTGRLKVITAPCLRRRMASLMALGDSRTTPSMRPPSAMRTGSFLSLTAKVVALDSIFDLAQKVRPTSA